MREALSLSVCTRMPHRLLGMSLWRSVKRTDSKGNRNQMLGCPLPKRKCWIWHRQREKERAQLVESHTAVAEAELTANCATGPWHGSACCNLFAKHPDRVRTRCDDCSGYPQFPHRTLLNVLLQLCWCLFLLEPPLAFYNMKHQRSSAVIKRRQHKRSINEYTWPLVVKFVLLFCWLLGPLLFNLFLQNVAQRFKPNNLSPRRVNPLWNRCRGEWPWLAHMLIHSLN